MRSHLLVGFFVALALTIFVSFTIWLTGRQGSEPTDHYSLYFQSDVSGLMMGGPVYYLGVEVGTVTLMKIISGDPMSVRVDIEVLATTPVDTGTSASLAFQGITGVAVVNLFGDPGMNLPLKKPPGEDYPVIEVRDSGLAALLSDAPGLMAKLNLLLDQASLLVSEENRSSIGETLKNIKSMSDALGANEQAFAELPGVISQTLSEMQITLAELRTAAADARPALTQTVGNIEEMSANLLKLSARLDDWSSENGDDMQHFLDDGLGQVPDLVVEARKTLRQMEKLLQEIRENPSRLIYKPKDEAVKLDE